MHVNGDFLSQVQKRCPQELATLDLDATLVETNRKEALHCYEGYKAYQHDLMRFCANPDKERFGVIEFAIGTKVSESFKRAVAEVEESEWHRLYRKTASGLERTGQEYAEVCFVPEESAPKKDGQAFRYLALREPLEQPVLPKLVEQISLPFPTMNFGSVKHKVFGIVTNRAIPGDELIWWYRQRCGKSEEAHSVMKEDLAGGRLPSGYFGVNAAWWHIMILALNLNSAMKHLVLGETWVGKRMKAIRFWLIKLPGRVLDHARTMIVRLVGGHESNETLFDMRKKIVSLSASG